jgi:WD40 repeat protein
MSTPKPLTKPKAAALGTASVKVGTKNHPKSTKPEGDHNLPHVYLDGVDRKPQLLYVQSYSLSEAKGVDLVGGLKVGTEDGIKFPQGGVRPMSLVDLTPTVPPTVAEAPPVVASEDGVGEDDGDGGKGHHRHDNAHNDNRKKKKKEEEVPDEDYTITLTETPTIFLLNIAGSAIANDAPNYQKVEKRNKAYAAVKAGHLHSTTLSNRSAQTLNRAQKTKAIGASPVKAVEMGCQASDWDIYDATGVTNNDEEAAAAAAAPATQLSAASTSTSTGTSTDDGTDALVTLTSHWSAAITAPDCMLSVTEAYRSTALPPPPPTGTSKEIIAATSNANVMTSPSLLNSLQLMERAVMQNLNHTKHLKYRAFPEGAEAEITAAVEEAEEKKDDSGENAGENNSDEAGSNSGRDNEEEDDEQAANLNQIAAVPAVPTTPSSSMSRLFTFTCPLSSGRTATSMSWNRGNPDILAVGYGSFHLSESEASGGYVMFWSIRNPSYPEKIIKTPSGVTAIDFSAAHPNMLAVGMYDGTVSIYDTRNGPDLGIPVLDSSQLATKHMDPVWEVKWVDKGPERGESLVSIATDGRVLEWSMKKGLTMTPLMVLKRVGNSDGVISRQASGLCLDFPIDDSAVYFAGTEDGHIHRCSCSYNEQYLDTFSGHSGPVYKIKCSPFHSDAFLSCSADWTVKLWSAKESRMVFDFHSKGLSDVVNDIAWSPSSATVFASVTGDGRVDVWDLDYSEIEPKIFHRPSPAESVLGVTPLTTCLFSDNAPVLATGDADGKVELFRLHGMESAAGPAEQTERLRKSMAPKEQA